MQSTIRFPLRCDFCSFPNYFGALHQSQVSTLSGNNSGFLDGPALSAMFYAPRAVAADAGGNLFIPDYQNNRIRRIDWLTQMVVTVAGGGANREVNAVGTVAQFDGPRGLTIINGSIWVADWSCCSRGTIRHIGIISFLFKYTFTYQII